MDSFAPAAGNSRRTDARPDPVRSPQGTRDLGKVTTRPRGGKERKFESVMYLFNFS